MVKENLAQVEERIGKACERAGRKREEVTLIAVSKTKPNEMIEEAAKAGITQFGENKVQEMTRKWEELPGHLQWHLIGHLQRNKAKYVASKVTLIHSVESLRLAETLNKEGEKAGRKVPVLVEVNVAGEESKHGIKTEETEEFVRHLSKLPWLQVQGLMTIAPFVDDPEKNRPHFRNLYQLSVDIKQKNIDNVNMSILSMGMTGDFEVAIEEGATMVRVGTAIFGARNYNQ